MIYDCWCWPWSPGWSSFCHISLLKSYSFPPHLHYCLWKEVTRHCPHLRNGVLGDLSLRVEYLSVHKLFGILLHRQFICFPLFSIVNHLLISGCTHEYFFYALGCNPILSYLFYCSRCSSFGSRELFQLAPMSLWQTIIFLEHFLTLRHYKMFQAHFVCSLSQS